MARRIYNAQTSKSNVTCSDDDVDEGDESNSKSFDPDEEEVQQ